MCARLLACPLCSQPGFLTLDALRAGLVSVATRPLVCPVCNEVLLGIDKLTIHLFGHTINLNNNTTESTEHLDTVTPSEPLVVIHNAHNIALQDWNMLKTQPLEKAHPPNSNNRTCTELPNSSLPLTECKVSILNSQHHTQNRNLSVKSGNRHTFMSDCNYDVVNIKANILSQLSENHNIELKSTANIQEPLKTNCAMQYVCNDNIKHLNICENNTQMAKTNISGLSHNIIENQIGKSSEKVAKVMDANIYSTTSTQCLESSNIYNNTCQRMESSACEEKRRLSEKHNDKKCLPNTKETILEQNVKDQNQNSEYEKVLCNVQTYNKTYKTVTQKENVERHDLNSSDNILFLTLHKQLVHEQGVSNVQEKILKNYACHLCSKVFKMRGSLMVHMRVAHTGHNLGSTPKTGQIELTYCNAGYNCPTCGKKFKKEQHVIQHLKTHEGKQWECDVCSKMFTTKYFLKKHKRLHSGEMPYKCNICDKNFTFQQSYHKHRLYHKDDKPHTCATCGRSFKELSTLHNHERIHTGEKPFACETCGKCFRQRVSYLVHRRIHTGVMPYKCTMCGKSFRYKVSQRTHKCPAQASGSTQQITDSVTQEINDESIKLQKINTLQDSHSMTTIVDNDENKFVLIINAQGQHVLARQSEINNISLEEKIQNMKASDINNINQDFKNKTWNTSNFNPAESKESTSELEQIKKVQLDHEKISEMKNTNDFFSMVMSPLENSISSPTFEMEHLRVSSPKQKVDSINIYTNFSQVSNNEQINSLETNMEQSFNCEKDITTPLQTINEESLKELLYGMDRK